MALDFRRLARLLRLTSDEAVTEAPDLNRVAELADQLAARILRAIENGQLTTEEIRNSPEVALIIKTAAMLQDAEVQFPPNMCRLGEKAGEQTQNQGPAT
jgi:hypothetical protein